MGRGKHTFALVTLPGLRHCNKCGHHLWGFLKNAYSCNKCDDYLCCKKCYQKNNGKIVGCKNNLIDSANNSNTLDTSKEGLRGLSNERKAELMQFYVQHVKRDATGNLIVQDLPDGWKQVLDHANITIEQFKDPVIGIQIIRTVQDYLNGTIAIETPAKQSNDKKEEKKEEQQKEKEEETHTYLAVAMYPWSKATNPDDWHESDLQFDVGDKIEVATKFPNGWAHGTCKGKSGSFPWNYVEEVVEEIKVEEEEEYYKEEEEEDLGPPDFAPPAIPEEEEFDKLFAPRQPHEINAVPNPPKQALDVPIPQKAPSLPNSLQQQLTNKPRLKPVQRIKTQGSAPPSPMRPTEEDDDLLAQLQQVKLVPASQRPQKPRTLLDPKLGEHEISNVGNILKSVMKHINVEQYTSVPSLATDDEWEASGGGYD